MGVTAHSEVGASGAYRWINCPGSVNLSKTVSIKKASEYAEKGTAAHELGERCLLKGTVPSDYLGEDITTPAGSVFTVDDDMVSGVTKYVNAVRNKCAVTPGAKLYVEQQFTLDWLFPGMFGTNDACVLQPYGTLYIYDYKNGVKVVNAEGNVQCMYYALGALGECNPFCIDEVSMNIVQPNAFKAKAVDTGSIKVKSLYEWGYDVLKPAAERTQDPNAPLCAGTWCDWCPAEGICEERDRKAVDTACEVFGIERINDPGFVLPAANILTPEKLALAIKFFGSPEFSSWVSSLKDAEIELLRQGVDIPGRKLIYERVLCNRSWKDTKAAEKALLVYGKSAVYTSKIKTPNQLAKAIAKKSGISVAAAEEIVNEHTERKPRDTYKAVDEDDPRPAHNDINQVKGAFGI